MRDLKLDVNLSRKLVNDHNIKSTSDFLLLNKETVDKMNYNMYDKNELKRAITKAKWIEEIGLI